MAAASGSRKRPRDDGAAPEDFTDVYIEGLPYAATEDEIRELLSTAGTVSSLRLPR